MACDVHRSLTRPANALLGRLLPTTEGDSPEKTARAAAANSNALRAHFAELTLAFVQPFTALLHPVILCLQNCLLMLCLRII